METLRMDTDLRSGRFMHEAKGQDTIMGRTETQIIERTRRILERTQIEIAQENAEPKKVREMNVFVFLSHFCKQSTIQRKHEAHI